MYVHETATTLDLHHSSYATGIGAYKIQMHGHRLIISRLLPGSTRTDSSSASKDANSTSLLNPLKAPGLIFTCTR
jgi:hypothetical protein